MVEALRLFWPQASRITKHEVDDYLKDEGIDEDGLYPQQRLYLETLARTSHGVCRPDHLRVNLGCDAETIRTEIETLCFSGSVQHRSGVDPVA